MIAVDTNILVYAVRPEAVLHKRARVLLASLADQGSPWAIPWPCIYEFFRVVTHPKVFTLPSTIEMAIKSVEQFRQSPSLVMLGDGPDHLRHLVKIIRSSAATGNLVHDAHIATLCQEHGVSELYTMDRDFSRFPGLKVVHPFSNR